ncbi:MAG: EthD domain-containing protein [Acidimicrobiales bacterium]|nr:EthD domain-containing protein [Acidimicrobiales bacterium]
MDATRALLHLVPAGGHDLGPALASVGPALTVLRRDPACFHGAASPQTAAVEAAGDAIDALVDVATELGPLIDAARSMAIVGRDRVFIEPAAPASVRYQYLMHRRADFTHDEYLHRYETVHVEFGLRTPNLEGYVQLHVDFDASAALGESTGLRAEPCDSMSELHLRSVEHFLEGIVAHPDVGREATEDEERFVDRGRSFGFAHRVV